MEYGRRSGRRAGDEIAGLQAAPAEGELNAVKLVYQPPMVQASDKTIEAKKKKKKERH